MSTLDPIKYIIGMDIGDGESAISFVSVIDNTAPVIFTFQGQQSIVTAIANSNDRTYIGQEALIRTGTIELNVNFKYDPISDPRRWRKVSNDLNRFAEELYIEFKNQYPEVAEHAIVYIGYPSGWSLEAYEEYSNLFRTNREIRKAEVVSESRSAFLHVRDYSNVSEEQLKSVLVIDIGSSTTDLTYVQNLDAKEINNGSWLGARLIDELFLETLIQESDDPSGLREQLSWDSKRISYLKYLCRKAKEYHFSNIDFNPESDDDLLRLLIQKFWTPLLNLSLEQVLAKQIPSLNKSWPQAFRDLLLQAKGEIKERFQTSEPLVIILTGGGSRMTFTKNICEEVFPSSIVSPDSDPSFSVCRGLAGYGRWRYRIDQFRAAINDLVNSDEVKDILRRGVEEFGREIYPEVMKTVYSVVLRDMALKLRSGDLSTDDMDGFTSYYYEQISRWLRSTEGQSMQSAIALKFLKPLENKLNKETESICKRFKIQYNALTLSLKNVDSIESWKISKSGTQLVDFLVKAADKLLPVGVRKIVPTWAVNTYFDVMQMTNDVGMSVLSPLYDQYMRFTLDKQNALTAEIRTQIIDQLDKSAKKAERLLL